MNSEEIQKQIITFFLEQEGMLALMLFGSYAKGNPTDRSDVDIAVFYEHANIPNQLDILDMKESLSEILSRDVDLICLNTANPVIGMQIYKTGKTIFNKNSTALDIFFTNLFIQYIEVKEMRKPMEEAILKRKIHD
jgi:predicted nucleotidyltransferase